MDWLRPFRRRVRPTDAAQIALESVAVPGPSYDHALIWWLAQHGPEELHKVALARNWDRGTWPLRYIVDRPDCDKGTALTIFFSGEPESYAAHNSTGPYHDPRYQKQFTQELVVSDEPYIWSEDVWMLRRICENWASGLYKTYKFFPGENAVFYLTKLKLNPHTMPWSVPPDLCDAVPQGDVLDIRHYGEGYPDSLGRVFEKRPDIHP